MGDEQTINRQRLLTTDPLAMIREDNERYFGQCEKKLVWSVKNNRYIVENEPEVMDGHRLAALKEVCLYMAIEAENQHVAYDIYPNCIAKPAINILRVNNIRNITAINWTDTVFPPGFLFDEEKDEVLRQLQDHETLEAQTLFVSSSERAKANDYVDNGTPRSNEELTEQIQLLGPELQTKPVYFPLLENLTPGLLFDVVLHSVSDMKKSGQVRGIALASLEGLQAMFMSTVEQIAHIKFQQSR